MVSVSPVTMASVSPVTMASATPDLPSPQLRSLDKLFDCPVCMEKFEDPHILLCGHHFCKRCLEGIASPLSHEQLGITCPTCRQTTSFSPGSNVSNLPRPVLLIELQQKITEINTGKAKCDMQIFCDCCSGTKVAATGHCYQCNKNLCDNCEIRHKKLELFVKHKIARITASLFCSQHAKELVTAYCTECEHGVCLLCAMGDHGEHAMKDIEDLANNSRANLQLFIESQEVQDLNSNLLKNITAKKTELKEAHNLIKTSTSALRKCVKQFQNRLDAVDHDVDISLAAELKGLELRECDISYSYASQKSLIRYAKSLLAFKSDPEVVVREKEFQKLPASSPDVNFEHTMRIPVVEKFNDLLQYTFKLIADIKAEYEEVTFNIESCLEDSKEPDLDFVKQCASEFASVTETSCDLPPCSDSADSPNQEFAENEPAYETSVTITGVNATNSEMVTQDVPLEAEQTVAQEETAQALSPESQQEITAEVHKAEPEESQQCTVFEEPPNPDHVDENSQLSNESPQTPKVIDHTISVDKGIEAEPQLENTTSETEIPPPKKDNDTVTLPQKKKYTEVLVGFDVRGICFDNEHRTLVARTSDASAPLKVFNYDGTGAYQIGKGNKGLTQVKRIAVDTHRNLYMTPVDDSLVTLDQRSAKIVSRIGVGRFLCGVSYCMEKDMYVVSTAPAHRHDGRIFVIDPNTKKVISSFSSRGAGPYNVHSGFIAGIADPGIVVSNNQNGCVKIFDLQGQWLTTYERNFEGDKLLGAPQDVCTDQNGRIIVCDPESNKIIKFWMEENQTFTQARDVGFNPWAVAVDPVEKLMAVTVEYSLIRLFADQND